MPVGIIICKFPTTFIHTFLKETKTNNFVSYFASSDKRGENSEEDSASIETKETFVPGGPFDVPKKKLHSGEV